MPTVWVYALRFDDGAIYVGLSKDLTRRLAEHARRQSPSLQRHPGAFTVIARTAFPDYPSARRHEKYLKSGAGRAELNRVRT